MNPSDKNPSKSADLSQLDALTGGAFSAPTSGERAARLRDWLASEPAHESMAEVYRELSVRDKGAAKALKEKLDDIKRAKAQDAMALEWAAKAQALLAQPRLNVADAMGWQRDAAKAGAALSREPLAGLKLALAERMKALEDVQHRVMVEREAAVLLAQRIELFSTKPWTEAQAALEGLRADVHNWRQQADALASDAAWPSVEPKYTQFMDAARQQLGLVWGAFEAAVAQVVQAAADPRLPLPAVPVWADELRAARGLAVAAAAPDAAESAARQAQAAGVVGAALESLAREVAQGHTKALPKVAGELRQALKDHGRHLSAELEAQAQKMLAQAGELEGWQRWRADQLREELLAKAVALTEAPEGQRLGGRKMQEALRALRDQWKATDQGGAPNHALWKKFDEACTLAHKAVEAWLGKIKEQNEEHRAQRLALIDAVHAWTQAHADSTDWKAQLRDLHAFAERWRLAGHLSEKAFAELQPLWKAAMAAAHVPLEAAQAQSRQRRDALIAEAQALGAAVPLRLDAVKALQQRWQQEAHAVPLDRRQEQKLWEAFRQPIDEAFARKSAEREKAQSAVSALDRAVLEAAKALDQACQAGDAQQIRAATLALQQAARGQAETASVSAVASSERVDASTPLDASASDAAEQVVPPATPTEDAPAPQPAPAQVVVRKVVAMRGDDRPGQVRAVPAATRPGGRDARDARSGPPRRDAREGRDGRFDDARSAGADAARVPRLGDAAFRAQRQALEQAEWALKKLASQAHGEALGQLLQAWKSRDASLVPAAQALGGRTAAAARSAWLQALAPAASNAGAALSEQALLRLEMAAEVPTPAEYIEARRALQLHMLTRRHDPAPADTWPQDVARVLGGAHEASAERRLQAALKVLLRR